VLLPVLDVLDDDDLLLRAFFFFFFFVPLLDVPVSLPVPAVPASAPPVDDDPPVVLDALPDELPDAPALPPTPASCAIADPASAPPAMTATKILMFMEFSSRHVAAKAAARCSGGTTSAIRVRTQNDLRVSTHRRQALDPTHVRAERGG